MPTTADLIRRFTEQRRDAEREAADAKDALKRFLARCDAQDGPETREQQDRADELTARHRAAVGRIDGAKAALDELRAVEDEDETYMSRATDPAQRTRGAEPPGRRESRAHITREARTYRPDEDPAGVRFLLDVAQGMALGNPAANERLARHMAEERVERPQYLQRVAGDTITSNWTGLVVPQYLTDLVAPATAALRPLADHVNGHPLPPDGVDVRISRVTTSSAVALQTTELTTGGEQSMDDTLLTIPVQTILGDQTVSRQAVERGTGVDDLVLTDLFRRVATLTDSTIINQATTGLLAAGQTTAYTDASPTPQLMWPNFGKAQSLLEQALLGVAVPDYIVMHPRRWNWFTSVLGTTWPLVGGPGVPAQSGAITLTNEYGSGVRGVLPNGMKVIVDGNLPTNLGAGTNQDPVLVIASEEIHLWEDPSAPMYIRAEATYAAKLGILLVAYSYMAYTCGRYANNPGIINGTGTIGPAGF